MAQEILAKGKGYAVTPWVTLGAADFHNVTLVGENGAGLLIEQKVGPGDNDAQPVGSLAASGMAGRSIFGPITYRIKRLESPVEAGCVREPEDEAPE